MKNRLKLLIVDDEYPIRAGLVRQFKEHEIELASSSNQAMDKLVGFTPDVILLDNNLGLGLKGVDICRQLKSDKKFENTIIIMLTSDTEKETIIEARYSGADDVIVKPYGIEKLKEKMHRLLYGDEPKCQEHNHNNDKKPVNSVMSTNVLKKGKVQKYEEPL